MRKKTFVLLSLIVISLVVRMSVISFNPIPYVKGTSLPSDGDAWTENDNATYPWIHNPTHFGEESFSTDFSQVGTYCLKANHTSGTTSYWFSMDIGSEIDVSSYWALSLWLRMENKTLGTAPYNVFYVTFGDNQLPSSNSGEFFSYALHIENATWYRIVLPLECFTRAKTPSFTNIRYFNFYVDGLSASDYVTFYIDGLHFLDDSADPTTVTALDNIAIPNLYSALLDSEMTKVWNSTAYTGLASWMNTSTADQIEGNLDTEALGQSIFVLCYLYNLTGWSFYLDKAIEYGTWLVQYQNTTYGAFHYTYNNVTEAFSNTSSCAISGWSQCGINWLYGLTGSQIWLDSAELGRSWFCDIMWNGTGVSDAGWFRQYNWTSASGYGSIAYADMDASGSMLAMATYYVFVDQNSTVKNHFDWAYQRQYDLYDTRTGGGISPYQRFYWGSSETTAYHGWGFYIMSQLNSSYTTLNLQYATQNLMSSLYYWDNGTIQNQFGSFYTTKTSYYKMFNWALTCNLELSYRASKIYDSSSQEYLQEIFRDSLYELKGNHWYIPFDDYTKSDNSWTPTALFFYMALLHYYIDNITYPYLISSDVDVTASSFADNVLSFTVDGIGTSTTRVYCGNRGEPFSVSGATYTYDSGTTILTLTVTHSSSQTVVIDWTPTSRQFVIISLIQIVPMISLVVLSLIGATVLVTIRGGSNNVSSLIGLIIIDMFFVVFGTMLILTVCNVILSMM